MNKYIVRRLMCGLCCIVTAFALSGCATGVEVLHKDASATLPPASVAWSAPVGDTEQETAQTVLIYVPNSAGTQLIAQAERVAISAARHPAEHVNRSIYWRQASVTLFREEAVKVEGGDFPAEGGKVKRQPCAAGKYNPALTASPSDTMLSGRLQPALCAITSPPDNPPTPGSESGAPGSA